MDNQINNVCPVLIGGTGRSGTNVSRSLIARHSQVASIPFEYRFIIDPEGIIDFYNSFSLNWTPYYADYKIKQLNNFLIRLSKRNPFSFFF